MIKISFFQHLSQRGSDLFFLDLIMQRNCFYDSSKGRNNIHSGADMFKIFYDHLIILMEPFLAGRQIFDLTHSAYQAFIYSFFHTIDENGLMQIMDQIVDYRREISVSCKKDKGLDVFPGQGHLVETIEHNKLSHILMIEVIAGIDNGISNLMQLV